MTWMHEMLEHQESTKPAKRIQHETHELRDIINYYGNLILRTRNVINSMIT